MKLIFLYGPPAVGKLTVAKELSKLTGFRIFHNHMVLSDVWKIFGYGTPGSKRLGRELRVRVAEETAIQKTDLIMTFAKAGEYEFEFFEQIINAVEKYGGQVLFVQLKAPLSVLVERTRNQDRSLNEKDYNEKELEKLLNSHPEYLEKYPKREHPTIETFNSSPMDEASKIIDYYKLVA